MSSLSRVWAGLLLHPDPYAQVWLGGNRGWLGAGGRMGWRGDAAALTLTH